MARILVIDDDRYVRDLATVQFVRAGHVVSVESDGEAGLAAALELKPDVTVVKWMLPRLTGLEVCSAIRRLPEDGGIARMPVLLLAGRAQETEIRRGIAAGITGWLVAPFSPRELVARAEAMLTKSMVSL